MSRDSEILTVQYGLALPVDIPGSADHPGFMVDRRVPTAEQSEGWWVCSADDCRYKVLSGPQPPPRHQKHPNSPMMPKQKA